MVERIHVRHFRVSQSTVDIKHQCLECAHAQPFSC
jgi:hypothetical protein